MNDLPAEIADSLSDEVKADPTLNQYKTFEDALKGHIATKSALGGSIRIPGEDAPDSDRAAFLDKLINNAPEVMLKPDFSDPDQSADFFRTLGKPEEVSKYDNPEGTQLNPDVETQLREVLFEANLTNAQYQHVVKRFSEMEAQTAENNQSVFDGDMQELAGKWGTTQDSRMAAARKMNEQFYPGRPFDQLRAKDIESLYNISVSMTGQGPQVHDQPDDQGRITPDEARTQADEIMRKVHDPDSNLSHSEKMNLIYKRIKLLKDFDPEFAEAS
jgi:hypothetical protein